MAAKYEVGSVVSAFMALVLAACSAGEAAAASLAEATVICNADPRVGLGLTPLNVCVGAELFFRGTFGGNGRSCSTCHRVANNFTIDPAFVRTLALSDPLFVAEQGLELDELERPDLMRDFGLILENVDGFEAPTEKFVMRGVPHMFSLDTSITAANDGTARPPNERTGWGGDGAPNPGELRDFQNGAITQHYTRSLARKPNTDFTLATADELNAIRAFSGGIGRTNELNLNAVTLTDPGANTGRTTFVSAAARCNGCHNNAGANASFGGGGNRNFDTGVERARIADLDGQGIPLDGGFGGAGLAAPNFDSDGNGTPDSFGNGTFSTPPLIEAADTGPFFHTNAFLTIEDAVAFYTTPAFNQSPAGRPPATPIALTTTEIADIGRFLRVLNGAFNAQIAMKRIGAAIAISDAVGNQSVAVQNDLLKLAREEVLDAIAVLAPFPLLNPASRFQLTEARGLLQVAQRTRLAAVRRALANLALNAVTNANSGLGTGLAFTMGPGTLMF